MSITAPENDQELESLLTETLGPPPCDDIDAWRKRYPMALAWLDPRRASDLSQRRKRMQRVFMAATTAAAAVCVWLALSLLDTNGTGASAFAQTVEQIQKAKTITWRQEGYERATNSNKTISMGIYACDSAYKAPGWYRDIRYEKTGQVREVQIRDAIHGRQLTYFPGQKKAIVEEIRSRTYAVWQLDQYKYRLSQSDLQWIGKQKTATGEVNVFRDSFRDHANERDWSIDFWIDTKTKQLVDVFEPGANIYDPENDRARSVPLQKDEHVIAQQLMGDGYRNIRYDVVLDDSLFSTEPPKGYTVATKPLPRITEKEMLDYLAVVADFNGKRFPDRYYEKGNSVLWCKPRGKFTAAERRLFEANQHYSSLESDSPVSYFVGTGRYVVPLSFRYLGKGAKLGDKNRIICWYKLKDAKEPNVYRVVYGDLSVKNVAAKDLPLPVEP